MTPVSAHVGYEHTVLAGSRDPNHRNDVLRTGEALT